jgi:probable rRNA maturation factor
MKMTVIDQENNLDFRFEKVMCRRKRVSRVIKSATDMTFKSEGRAPFSVSYLITNNRTIKDINRDFRNIDQPTDVLSFPSTDTCTGDEDSFFGDIIISLNKVRDQAKRFDQSFEKELIFLTIHGCLHLLGYDHINPDDEKIMRAKQREILIRLTGENK